MVRADLYIALVNCGVDEDAAAMLADADRPDLEGALIAVARKLCEIQRALDKLEDGAASNMGEERTKRFCPRPPEQS